MRQEAFIVFTPADDLAPKQEPQHQQPQGWLESAKIYTWSILCNHYNDVIMSTMASQITSITNVYSTVYSGADQRKHQSSASLAFLWGIHRRPVNSPHKWPVTRKMFPFDDVIMHGWSRRKLRSREIVRSSTRWSNSYFLQRYCTMYNPRPLSTKPCVLTWHIAKFRSSEIWCQHDNIAVKSDRRLGSTAVEAPVKFHSDRTTLNPHLAASRLREILRDGRRLTA